MRRRLPSIAAALSIAAATPLPAQAELIDVTWDAAGRFQKDARVAAGKFVEVCEKLPAGARVRWRFESAAPLNFNIHYHVGKDVHYPVKHDGIARADGTLDVTLAQDYCWMWSNKGDKPAGLKLLLDRS